MSRRRPDEPSTNPRTDAQDARRFRTLANGDHDAIAEIGADGRLYYASPNHAHMAGVDPAILETEPTRDRIHPEDVPELAQRLEPVFQRGESARFAYRARDASGDYLWGETTVTPFTAEDGSQRALLVTRDMGDVKALERELAETANRLELMMDHAYDVIAVYDDGGRLLYANKRSQEVFGWQATDMPRGHPSELVHPEDRERVNAEMAALPERPVLVSQRVRRVDGSFCWIESNSSTYETSDGERRVVVVARDVSEREEAQAQLRASEARYRELVEASPAAILVLEGKTVRYANRAAVELFGVHSAEELAGRDVLDFVHPDDVTHMLTLCDREMQSNDFTEFRIVRPDGSRRIVLGSGTPTEPVGGEGSAPVFQVVLRDNTSLREAEEERLRLSHQLAQAQRMESLGVLAGGVAHDFNNLLQVILANANMLSDDAEGQSVEMLDEVIQAGETAARLTRQLLAYAGRGDPDVRPVRLSEHVRSFSSLLEAAIPKKVRLHFELGEDLPSVMADVAQFEHVLMNLVRNAGESHGEAGGTVIVATGAGEIDAAEIARWQGALDLAPGRYAWLEVRDTGSGMDPQTQARIFDPFYSTKSAGHGLGLSMVLGLVRSHCGGLSLESTPGAGTRFRVHLPAVEEDLPEHVEVTAPERPGALAVTVLVVDDEEGIRRLVRRLLGARGCNVLEAADGAQALEIIEAHGDSIDVVLLDLNMPKRGGAEVRRILRERHGDIPVLLASGFDEHGAAREFSDDAKTAFIEKPFGGEALVAALRAVLDVDRGI